MNENNNELMILENEVVKLVISPKIGASIFSFMYKLDGNWINIMRPTPYEAVVNNDPGSFASFNMIPFSNRIEKGILSYEAQTYQLAINNPEGHAIHGEVRNRPWRVKRFNRTKVELEFNSPDYTDISWPFRFKAHLKYEIDENRLLIDTKITNISDVKMPVGMGIHPYFVRNLTGDDDKVLLQLSTKGIYPGETPIPVGRWQAIPPQLDFNHERELTTDFLDKCYRLDTGIAAISWENSGVKLVFHLDSAYKHLVLYCPKDDNQVFALEPVTNCNNGFNMANQGVEDTGTLYLLPGEEVMSKIRINVVNESRKTGS